jgi:hypothetical protein
VGTFRITPGACAGASATGSTFRMVVPGGGPQGAFVNNNDSACSNHSYTLLTPGTDGGLVTGAYQPQPTQAFDRNGNSLAARLTKPTRFYGVAFSTSTNAVDPQTGARVGVPAIAVQHGRLSGDLRAFAASWNRQQFNQGGPKPDGSKPGNTAAPTGTYDATTGKYTLDWASLIQGGPFNNFTGYWPLEGTFVATRGGAAANPSVPATTDAPATPTPSAGATGGTGSSSGAGAPVSEPSSGAAAATPTTLPAAGAGATPTTASTTGATSTGGKTAAAASRDTADDGGSDAGPIVIGVVALVVALAGGGWYLARRRRVAA